MEKIKRWIPIQPYIINGGLYLTEKKALPVEYDKYVQRLKYKTVEPELPEEEADASTRKPTTNKIQGINPERLDELSKPKSASSTRLKDYPWFELTHKAREEEKCDFNFVVK